MVGLKNELKTQAWAGFKSYWDLQLKKKKTHYSLILTFS